ncbi:MAG: MmcQ/YjbR family DNA-binding protein, partial [Clostridia bacterium]|nr:MmcQ/YjbR family DNA-binding protein [Clostridia bacterium]
MLDKKAVVEYCLTFAGAYEDYPFDDKWAAMRAASRKCFAFIYERGGVCCLNLKCEPVRADFLRHVYRAVTPAYHMNKEHWNTVALDGSVPDDEVFSMIGHSFALITGANTGRGRSG